jgi:hypothetical protein
MEQQCGDHTVDSLAFRLTSGSGSASNETIHYANYDIKDDPDGSS